VAVQFPSWTLQRYLNPGIDADVVNLRYAFACTTEQPTLTMPCIFETLMMPANGARVAAQLQWPK
jgi:hypothetical protein